MIRSTVWGMLLVVFGAWLWTAKVNPELIPEPTLARDWPLLIVVVGLLTIAGSIEHSVRHHRSVEWLNRRDS